VVHFGDRWPTVPDAVIAELRAAVGEEELCVVPGELVPGDEVRIIGGSFQGLHAVVARVMPGRERVAVLMEFLGRQTSIELPASTIIKPGQERTVIL
jgi:transcription antitermination factor NusG